jgi:hypothetical protein
MVISIVFSSIALLAALLALLITLFGKVKMEYKVAVLNERIAKEDDIYAKVCVIYELINDMAENGIALVGDADEQGG